MASLEGLGSPDDSSSEGDEQSIPCTLCGIDLNHPLYDVCEHPRLPVPVCMVCCDGVIERTEEEQIEKDEADGDSDRCSWCLDFSEELFICGDASKCHEQFCAYCLSSNLGDGFVEAVKRADLWQCLCCDSSPLAELGQNLERGQAQSAFRYLPVDRYSNIEDREEALRVMGIYVQLIEHMVTLSSVAATRLEQDSLDDKEFEIRNELRSIYGHVAKEAKDELDAYRAEYETQFRLAQHQEGYLNDRFMDLKRRAPAFVSGVNEEESQEEEGQSLPCYVVDTREDSSAQAARNKASKAIALREREHEQVARERRSQCISLDFNEALADGDVDEALVRHLQLGATAVAENAIVREYSAEVDPPTNSFPASFGQLPQALLKALFYATPKEVEELSTIFNIPRHIALVMMAASSEESTPCVAMAGHRLHPAVIKAVSNSKNAVDLGVLCREYDLDEEAAEVVDIGSAEHLLETRRVSKGKPRLLLKEYKEATECEEEMLRMQTKKLKQQAEARRAVGVAAKYDYNVAPQGEMGGEVDEVLLLATHVDEAADDEEMEEELKQKSAQLRRRQLQKSATSGGAVTLAAEHLSIELPQNECRIGVVGDGEEMDIDNDCVASPGPVAAVAAAGAVHVGPAGSSPWDSPSVGVAAILGPPHESGVKSTPAPQRTSIPIIDLTQDLSDDDPLPVPTSGAKRNRFHIDDDDETPPKSAHRKSTPGHSGISQRRLSFEPMSIGGFDLGEPLYFKGSPKQASKKPRPSGRGSGSVDGGGGSGSGGGSATNGMGEIQPFTEGPPHSPFRAEDFYLRPDGGGGVVMNKGRRGAEPAVLLLQSFIDRGLKDHQVSAIQFMWSNVMRNSLGRGEAAVVAAQKATGCIVAHCMGLGKTFTVIAFIMTLLTNPVVRGLLEPQAVSNDALSQGADDDTTKVPKMLIHRVLVIAPKNTVQNWKDEFTRWTPRDVLRHVGVRMIMNEPPSQRVASVQQWFTQGGVLIVSYDMFRLLSSTTKARGANVAKAMRRCLLNPGPDLVVADEAHFIKASKSAINKVLTQIRTRRRVALTGSPLQNNLIEYHTMVDWVKKGHLHSVKAFKRRFVIPIVNGERKDSSPAEIKEMRRRTHMLNQALRSIVDRKDASELCRVLPPKREFVLTVKMTDFQKFQYRLFLLRLKKREGRMNFLFCAYQALLRVWSHPLCVVMNSLKRNAAAQKGRRGPRPDFRLSVLKRELLGSYQYFLTRSAMELEDVNRRAATVEAQMEGTSAEERNPSELDESIDDDDSESNGDSLDNFVVDDDAEIEYMDDVADDAGGPDAAVDRTGCGEEGEGAAATGCEGVSLGKEPGEDEVDEAELVGADWWRQEVPVGHDFDLSMDEVLGLSNKVVLVLALLASAVEQGDKMLIFTQSLMVMDLLERILGLPEWGSKVKVPVARCSGWTRGVDFLRIDGSVNDRQALIDRFNDSANTSIKLMLISTRAGNMGINLQAANRVVIFDTSWNPVNDLQAIYRAYRFGQKKSVFVYRLLAAGTMEQQIYKRAVTKQALAARVVDGQMPGNHFSEAEQRELLTFTEDDESTAAKAEEVLQSGTQDRALTRTVQLWRSLLVQIEDQDTFLEDQHDLHLDEEERKAAEAEYEKEEQVMRRLRSASRAPSLAASGFAVPVPAGAPAGGAVSVAATGGEAIVPSVEQTEDSQSQPLVSFTA